MRKLLAVFALLACAITAKGQTGQARPSHPDMPSVGQLTAQEKQQVAALIWQVILDDLGAPTRNREQMLRNFQALGPEAVPQLLEAFIYSANKGWTCPTGVLGKKLGAFLDRKYELDIARFLDGHIGKGIANPQPCQQFKDLQVGVRQRLETFKREVVDAIKLLKVGELVAKLADARGGEWGAVVAELGRRRDSAPAFDALVAVLEKGETHARRKAAWDALVAWSGVDLGPANVYSLGEAGAAAGRWREWRRSRK